MKQEELARVLDGNTCRCTGYRPIMNAFQTLIKEKPCVDIEVCYIFHAISTLLRTHRLSYHHYVYLWQLLI